MKFPRISVSARESQLLIVPVTKMPRSVQTALFSVPHDSNPVKTGRHQPRFCAQSPT